MAMSASEARRRLFPLIEQVKRRPGTCGDRLQVWHRISGLGRSVALLYGDSPPASIPANAERLLRSIADADAGRISVEELIDPQHDAA